MTEQPTSDALLGRSARPASPFVLALRLPAVPDAVTQARREVRQLAERSGMSAARCADVALAVGEVCANAVIHAYREGEGTFTIHAQGRAGHLDVVVADQGCGLAPRHDSPGAGYGLPLVAAVSSALELRVPDGGGTEVRMAFQA